MSANLELRAKLRLRSNTLVNKYMESAMPPSRADFVELVHNALIEASMLGCELAVHELYSLSGLDRSPATTSAADVTHTLQPRSNHPEALRTDVLQTAPPPDFKAMYADWCRYAKKLEVALQEIAKGEGAFSRDPLEHAKNTIENMKAIALGALGPQVEKP